MFSAPETTIYMDGFPEGWLLGVNLAFFNTTSEFKGVKLLPRGLHVIHWGPDSTALRTARFLIADTHSFFVIRWSNVNETPTLEYELDELDLSAIKARVASGIYSYMLNYSNILDADSTSYWTNITQSITPDILNQVLGQRWVCDSASCSLKEHAELEKILPNVKNPDPIVTLDFANIDTMRTWPPGVQGPQLTMHARDTSWYLNRLIDVHFAGRDQVLFGHLQLSYLILVILANYSAYAFYVSLLEVILRCRVDLAEHKFRFRVLFDQLARHLKHFPLEQFSGQSKLKQAFANLQHDLEKDDLKLDPAVGQSAISCLHNAQTFLRDEIL